MKRTTVAIALALFSTLATAQMMGPGPGGFVPSAGMWWNPSESGTGYNVHVEHGTMVMTMFTYDTSGRPMWYLAVAPLSESGGRMMGSGTLDRYAGGQCMMCSYRQPTMTGNDGMFTVTFTSPDHAVVQLPGGRTVDIEPMHW